jgi:all-trans-retinol 13,14-reductase
MRYEEVKQWEDTFNTVAHKNDRGQTYTEFKAARTETFLQELEKKFPDIRECILSVYTSTPLSYRDYIGCNQGAMYGYTKDVNNPLKSFISPKTKISNVFFTGQSLNMHGILGVTISGVVTCSEILGSEYLLNKIVGSEKKNTEKVKV